MWYAYLVFGCVGMEEELLPDSCTIFLLCVSSNYCRITWGHNGLGMASTLENDLFGKSAKQKFKANVSPASTKEA